MTRILCNRELPFNLLVLCTLILGLLVSTNAMAEPAGRLLFARGDVQLERVDTPPRQAKRGDTIDVGDTLRTGADGSAQLRLTDGAMIALRANTTYIIEEQSYDKAAPQNGSQVGKLLRGGLRAITGAIGKTNPDSVTMKTPVATIGIRGTTYELIYIPSEGLPGVTEVEAGLYALVLRGRIAMMNDGGELALAKGEIGYTADMMMQPSLRPDLSWLFAQLSTLQRNDSPVTERYADDRLFERTESIAVPRELDVEDIFTDSAAEHSHDHEPYDPGLDNGTGDPIIDDGTGGDTVATLYGPYAYVLSSDFSTLWKGSFLSDPVVTDGAGELLSANNGTGDITSFEVLSTTPQGNTGSITTGSSDVYWGTYDITEYLPSTGLPLNYMTATNVLMTVNDLPITGSYTYNYAGGSGEPLESGSHLAVDFGVGTMSAELIHSSYGIMTTGSQSISEFYGAGLTSSQSEVAGSISGRFVGSAAEGAITTFEFDSLAAGTAAFTR